MTTRMPKTTTINKKMVKQVGWILSELHSGVLTLTFNRPEKANAFNLAMVAELQAAFKQAARNEKIRCVVLTGAGKAFCAGHDTSDMLDARTEKTSYRTHLLATYNPLILQIRQIEKPVVAAVNGPTAGAGLGIALACDLRLAADTAQFTVGFSGIGLAPDSAVSLLLPALIGLGRASEFAFTNSPISAAQALQWGLVNRVVPLSDLPADTDRLARELAAGPVGAFGLTKRAFNRAVMANLEEVLDYEAHLQDIASKEAEHSEGVTAFLEKRPPMYS